jgi:hypothetical protein
MHWDGATWHAMSGVTGYGRTIWGDGVDVWAAGDNGLARYTGGTTWTPEEIGTIEGIFGLGGAGGVRWAVGSNATVLTKQ